MQYVIARAKERSTWSWLLVLASMAGAKIQPDMQEAIITVGIGAAGALAVLFPDGKK